MQHVSIERKLAEQTLSQQAAGASLQRAAAIMAILRGPDGCPWDREQTFDSIKRHTLEETYEVFDAIERRAWHDLKDELGDLLLQVLFYAQMATEAQYFTLEDVAENLSAKLIRRHPHIFAQAEATTADAVLRNWDQIKLQEKQAKRASGAEEPQGPESLLSAIPRTMPALLEATKIASRAAKVGFDWPNLEGLFAKLAEETAELRAEIEQGGKDRIEAEFGDLLFTVMNLARHLQVDAESALRRTNATFRNRFGAMEQAAGPAGLAAKSSVELERLWAAAKLAQTQDAAETGQA